MSTNKNKQSTFTIVVVLLIVTTMLWQVIYQKEHSENLSIAFLDVGQGDAIFIESPTGMQVLIDGGRDSGVLRELARVMPFYDRSIDIVVATHPDTDHIGGLVDVLERFTVRYILRPGVAHDAPAAESLLLNIAHQRDAGAVEVLARRGQVYDLGGGALLHVLFPDREVSGLESNTASIILRLEYGETSVMLTGDSPDSIEEYLVSIDGALLKSDILKLGHHGSKTSSAEAFLGFVSPQWAIVSAGADNSYGHPHQEVLERAERFGSIIKSTAQSGTIIFESNGQEWKLE